MLEYRAKRTDCTVLIVFFPSLLEWFWLSQCHSWSLSTEPLQGPEQHEAIANRTEPQSHVSHKRTNTLLRGIIQGTEALCVQCPGLRGHTCSAYRKMAPRVSFRLAWGTPWFEVPRLRPNSSHKSYRGGSNKHTLHTIVNVSFSVCVMSLSALSKPVHWEPIILENSFKKKSLVWGGVECILFVSIVMQMSLVRTLAQVGVVQYRGTAV